VAHVQENINSYSVGGGGEYERKRMHGRPRSIW
jgi:hypothetical protein